MGEVPGGIHEGVVDWGYGLETENSGVTMLLTVGAMKFRALVVGMARGGSSAGGTMVMGRVGVKVFSGSTCETSSWNDFA